MGFFTGRVSFVRFRVEGRKADMFGPEHLEKLEAKAIDKQVAGDKDGIRAGWIAGDDILDLDFDLAKNIVNDTLHCCLRTDTRRLPGDLLRSYMRVELQALAANNPSGKPSNFQKRKAREAARERLEAEAKDGRFTRRKAYPLLWDALTNCLLIGTSSAGVVDRVRNLFQDTFNRKLVFADAGHQAGRSDHSKGLENVKAASFVPSTTPGEVAWVGDPASFSYLGNEFLLWLWFILETDGDEIRLSDKSVVTVMLARTLLLDCPRAVSGNGTLRSESPTKLPESRRAIQSGKLPRQAGLILVRQGQQYEFTLRPESMAVTGAKLPPIEENDDRARLEERVSQMRDMIETLDLLFEAFLKRRLTAEWPKELKRMQQWLKPDGPGRIAEAG
jgi:hypothetical protein